jgi:hypothetical protein
MNYTNMISIVSMGIKHKRKIVVVLGIIISVIIFLIQYKAI